MHSVTQPHNIHSSLIKRLQWHKHNAATTPTGKREDLEMFRIVVQESWSFQFDLIIVSGPQKHGFWVNSEEHLFQRP